MNRSDMQWAFEHSLQDIIRSELNSSNAASGSIRTIAAEIDPHRRRLLRRCIARYRRCVEQSALQAQSELNKGIIAGAKGAGRILVRGAAIGTSAAGIINTAAPGLFSTALGYIAGSMKGTALLSTMTRLGLVTAGVFTPPVISQYAILAFGAAAGIAGYAVCFLIGKCVSAFRR